MAVNYTDIEKMLEHDFLIILLQFVIIYLVGVVFSLIAKKLKMPAVLGFIIGGIALGFLLGARTPFTFITDHLGGFVIDGKTPFIYDFAQIGAILILFLAGLETNFSALKKYFSRAFIIATGVVLFSVLLTLITIVILEGNYKAGIGMGVVVASTSVSISIQTLKEMGQHKRLSSILNLEAAIIDDVIGLILITLLGVFMNPAFAGVNSELFIVVAKILALFVGIALVGAIIIKINKKFLLHEYIKEYSKQILMGVIAFCFILAFLAQILGVSVIIGAYFAGLMLSTTKLKHHMIEMMTPIAEIVFAPIFFLAIGLTIDLRNIGSIVLLGILISVIAVIGKIAGCYFGGRLSGFNNVNSLKIGVGMIPRGEVSFITASIAAGLGILSLEHMSVAVMVIIATSILTPALLKIIYKKS